MFFFQLPPFLESNVAETLCFPSFSFTRAASAGFSGTFGASRLNRPQKGSETISMPFFR